MTFTEHTWGGTNPDSFEVEGKKIKDVYLDKKVGKEKSSQWWAKLALIYTRVSFPELEQAPNLLSLPALPHLFGIKQGKCFLFFPADWWAPVFWLLAQTAPSPWAKGAPARRAQQDWPFPNRHVSTTTGTAHYEKEPFNELPFKYSHTLIFLRTKIILSHKSFWYTILSTEY